MKEGQKKSTGITPKMRKLIACYNGSIKAAAAEAGASYAYARRLFSAHEEFKAALAQKDSLALAMAAEAMTEENVGRILSASEIQAWWTELIIDETRADGTRLDASNKLAKSKAMFIERVKIGGDNKPIKVKQVDLRDRINSIAGIKGDTEPEDDFLDL